VSTDSAWSRRPSVHADLTRAAWRPHAPPAEADGMTRLLLVLLVAATGCLIVPRTTTTVLSTRRVESAPTFGPAGPIQMTGQTTSSGHVMHLTVARPRMCTATAYDLVEKTTTTSAQLAELGNGSGDPRGVLGLIAVEPALLVVSGLITEIVVAASSANTWSEQVATKSLPYPCAIDLGNVAVKAVFASGETFDGVTVRDGTVDFAIPDTAPPSGTLTVYSPGASPALLYYGAPVALAAGETARDVRVAVVGCVRDEPVSGALLVTFVIDGSGHVATVSTDRGTRDLALCIGAKLARTPFADRRGATIETRFRFGT
jgi:hypothetical protein